MRKLSITLIFMALACLHAPAAFSEPIGGFPIPPDATAEESWDLSLAYLDQARDYRDAGRYELARQSYAQALSVCRNTGNLEIIKRELAGVELLIRTMR